MRKHLLLITLATAVSACSQQAPEEPAVPAAPATDAALPEGVDQLVVRANEIEWQACPPTLPEGCEMKVLEGDLQGTGIFSVRFKAGTDFYLPSHTHPLEERVTVLDGQVAVAFGENAAREDATEFGPGDYYVNARDKVHSVWVDDAATLQITGLGPWRADFIEQEAAE